MRTSVTELGDSRVRVDVGIEPDAVEHASRARRARSSAREMRMPGFRKGKVPPQLVIQRVGREAVLEQALRDSLPEWYERALLDTGITPVGDPKLDVPSLPDAGEELAFTIEVGGAPGGEARRVPGARGRAGPRPRSRTTRRGRARPPARGLREPRARSTAPPREGDLVVIDYSGTVGRRAVRGLARRAT